MRVYLFTYSFFNKSNGDVFMKRFSNVVRNLALMAGLFLVVGSLAFAAPKKRVLVEEGTGAWCGFCPRGATTLANMIAKYPDQVVGVAWHNGGGTNDKMTMTNEPDYSGAFINGYPNGTINRKRVSGSGTKIGLSDNAWEGAANAELAIPATVDVAVKNLKFDGATRTLSFDVNATFTSVPTQEVRFNGYIAEDSVSGTGAGYDQHNYMGNGCSSADPSSPWYNFPCTITGFKHRHVMRQTIGGTWGDAGSLSSVVVGTAYTKTYSVVIPAAWNEDKIMVVGLVQAYDAANAENRTVLNCASAELTGTPTTTEVAATGNIFDVMPVNTSLDAGMSLKNISDKSITYQWKASTSARTPADWKTGFSQTGTITLAAGASQNFVCKLIPGATIGIGDATFAFTEVGNPASKTYGMTITVVSKETKLLNIISSDESANSPLAIIKSTTGRSGCFDISNTDFNQALSKLTNLKTVIWSTGSAGGYSSDDANAILNLNAQGVGVLLDGQVGLTMLSFASATHPLFSTLGFSMPQDPNIANQNSFNIIGYASDPISNGINIPCVRNHYVPQQMVIDNDQLCFPILRLQSLNRVVGLRTETDYGRVAVIGIDQVIMSDAVQRKSLFDKALIWIEAYVPQPKLITNMDSTKYLDFGTVSLGQTKTLTFDVMPGNTTALPLDSITFFTDAGSFAITNTSVKLPAVVKAEDKVTVTATFTPTKNDINVSSTLALNYHDKNGDQLGTLDLRGTVGAAGVREDGSVVSNNGDLTLSVGPNPISNNATVQYTVKNTQAVKLSVFNTLGQEVAVLVNGVVEAGANTVNMSSTGLPVGTYSIVLRSGNSVATLPVAIVK